MAPQLKNELCDCLPTIKNTFLTFEFEPTQVTPRCSSVPRSSRLCQETHLNMCDSQLHVVDNEGSTCETDSDSGTRTPMSLDGLSAASSYVSPQEVNVYPQLSGFTDDSAYDTDSELEGLCTPSSHKSAQEAKFAQDSRFTPTSSLQVAPPPKSHSGAQSLNPKATPYIAQRRLNAQAAVFQPQEVHARGNQHCQKSIDEERLSSRVVAFKRQEVCQVYEPQSQHYTKNIAEVIRMTKALVKMSEHVKDVQVFEEGGSWSVTIQPQVIEANNWQTQLLVALAKEALLDAATKSKYIYVLGYCDPQPFSVSVQGFQATLGVMQNAATACWHIFKKGFCRHGDICCKQHPPCQTPVRFLVEGVQLKPDPFFASVFKVQAADLALSVTAALGGATEVESAEAFKDKDNQGWTIELTGKEEKAVNEECLLNLAKSALLSATVDSELLHIIGYAANPFVKKLGGFVVFVSDMQDESRVCWDMYSKGVCSRGKTCRYQHPESLMPINVVVK